MDTHRDTSTTRRTFIKTTGAAAIGGSLAYNIGMAKPFSNNNNTLKVGLIGCGGRGTGAANQALNADDNVVLAAMADIFPDKMEKSFKALKNEHPDKIQVPDDQKYIGFDAYERVLESDVDVVILTTPPSFRPAHLEAAVKAGKHIFCEKPMAVDVPGIHRVLEAARQAKEKGLSLVSGFCWRFDSPKRATFQKVLDGEIGDIVAIYNTYNTGALWSYPREDGWSDMEYKLRNWLYYNWISGDHIIEQAIHSIDMMSWAMGDVMPVSVSATGGRQSRTEDIYGNIFDHFAVVYEYENGARGFHFSRQQKDCTRSYAVQMMGTEGTCNVDCTRRKHEIVRPYGIWEYENKDEDPDMYQVEHDELFASIRNQQPINDGEWMAHSTFLGIWGRMAAYTGQTISFDEAYKSTEVLGPGIDEYSWDLDWPSLPVAQPGITKFS